MELGYSWLVKDFHPTTVAKANGRWRLLILDGHNSHLTYGFCYFAKTEKIMVICLPPHTTHVLQPCDVGVFGPLAAAWKKQVRLASRQQIRITPNNFLHFYSRARATSVTPVTIFSSFMHAGISPLNPAMISPALFEPSKNTTTAPAPTVHVVLPTLLEPVSLPLSILPTTPTPALSAGPSTSPTSGDAVEEETPLAAPVAYQLVNEPVRPSRTASQMEWTAYADACDAYQIQCREIMSTGFARQTIMAHENGKLRMQLHDKRGSKRAQKDVINGPRHMTDDENLLALKLRDFRDHVKEIGGILAPALAELKLLQRKAKNEHHEAERAAREWEKAVAREAKRVREEEEKAAKQAKRDEEKRVRDEKKAREAAEAAERKRVREEKAAQRRFEEAQRKADAAERKAELAQQKAEAAQRKAEAKAAAAADEEEEGGEEADESGRGTKKRKKRSDAGKPRVKKARTDPLADNPPVCDPLTDSGSVPVRKSRPRPRPAYLGALTTRVEVDPTSISAQVAAEASEDAPVQFIEAEMAVDGA